MAGRGGYQRPQNPAPVSGPGRLSRRTDGGPAAQNVADLPNAGYGENAEFTGLQAAAPMSASPPPSMAGRMAPGGMGAMLGGGGAPAEPPVPLTAATQRPDEPLTAGAPFGEGVGPAPEVMAPMAGRVSATFERLLGDDLTGELADMYERLRRQGM